MNSIRVFLVVVTLAVFTLFTFVAALKGYQSSMEEAERLFDKQLLETARLIANIYAETTTGNIDHDSDFTFQVWQEGEMKASSINAPPTPIAAPESGFDFSNFNGYRWRTVAYFDENTSQWIIAAERVDLRYALAEKVIRKSIVPVLIGLPIVGLLIWVIVSQGLKPLHKLANELENKQPHDLSPLSIRAPRRELEQIVISTNGLLERLETSLLREKQFASDAAHELRTPISILKVQLHNLGQELSEYDPGVAELDATAERLEHLVEQILDLYRNSPDQFHASFEPIDISALAQEILAREYPCFEAKNQALEFQGSACVISGDRFALSTMIRNLLSNANKYTPPEGQVMVSIDHKASGATLTFEDSGPGIPEDQRQKVFERFYRVGGDRHKSGEPGCGLGLAIVKHIIDLHNGSITVSASRFKTGTAFHVNFPPARAGQVSAIRDI
ncbi:MAG: ATP-binding protein [Xanthomonadales bacterium]|nr:ATP-binding protein [Xanthomonadales bacterium]